MLTFHRLSSERQGKGSILLKLGCENRLCKTRSTSSWNQSALSNEETRELLMEVKFTPGHTFCCPQNVH